MAGEQNSNATDTLSADIKALQDRVEKLTDKLNDTQREVVQLRAELGGQDKRLTDTVGRIGDVNIWLAGFAVIITLAIAVAGVFTYLQAAKRAADEAAAWIEKNTTKLRRQIKSLEGEADALKGRMDDQAKGFEDHIRTETERVTAMVSGSLESLSKLGEGDKKALDQAARQIQAEQHHQKTAKDWWLLAYDAYAAQRFDQAVTYFDMAANSPDASTEQVAQSLFNKGMALGALGRSEEELAVYDEVDRRFGTAFEPALRSWVARSLRNKGVTFGELGRSEEEIAVYDEVDRRFGMASEPEVREQVAKSLFNKGVSLGGLGCSEDAIAVYDEVDRRFGTASEPELREQVAKSLYNKGGRLEELGRSEDAIAVYDELDRRFGTAPELRESVASACGNRGWQRYLGGDYQRFLADTERALECLPQADWLLCNQAFALHLAGRSRDEVMGGYRRAWSAIQDSKKWAEMALTDLRNHGRTVRSGDEPVPDDLIAQVAALAVNKE